MKAKFQTAATVFMLLVGGLLLYWQAQDHFRERALFLHPGDRLPSIQKISWVNHERTLLLALRNGCHYCDASMPFYEKVASAIGSQSATQVTAVVPDDGKSEEQLFKVFRLGIPIVGNVAFNTLKIAGTPTIILVDKRGRVEKVWPGQLSPSGEEEVIAAVRGTAVSRN